MFNGLNGPTDLLHRDGAQQRAGLEALRRITSYNVCYTKLLRRKISYFYGARSAADLFYSEEFEAIATSHPNFTWTPALSDPAPGDRWTGATGLIHETVRLALSSHPAPEACDYYLCGPPVMISAVLATLQRLGVERHSIFNDDFGT